MNSSAEENSIDLSIIILNYNTKKLTEQAVKSIEISTFGLNYEIIIVDNSNKEDEVFKCPVNSADIHCIKIENKGFSNGCNLGASFARGNCFLFLNSDVIMHPFTLKRSLDYLKAHPEAGALGVKILLSDGTMDHGCRRGFPTPINSLFYFFGLDKKYPENPKFGGYRLNYLDENEISEVDAVSGAFIMMPRPIFEQLKGFDEKFFMYGEDLDLCYRVKEAGYKVVYYPKATMLHLKGQSGLNTKNKLVQYHFYNSMIIFYDKHYGKKYNALVRFLAHIAIRLKYLIQKKPESNR